jgi:hypothetical protein
MIVRIALYSWTSHPDWELVPYLCTEAEPREHTDLTRVSEPIEIEFPEIGEDAVLLARLKSLDRDRGKVVEEFTRQLQRIDEAKAKLLALTHQPSKRYQEPSVSSAAE